MQCCRAAHTKKRLRNYQIAVSFPYFVVKRLGGFLISKGNTDSERFSSKRLNWKIVVQSRKIFFPTYHVKCKFRFVSAIKALSAAIMYIYLYTAKRLQDRPFEITKLSLRSQLINIALQNINYYLNIVEMVFLYVRGVG